MLNSWDRTNKVQDLKKEKITNKIKTTTIIIMSQRARNLSERGSIILFVHPNIYL